MNLSVNFLNIGAVGVGAAIGAWSRWGLNLVFNHLFVNLPLGTLLANLSGGLMMGLILALIDLGNLEHASVRLLITTGFLGGLTTFSAFTGESLTLLQKHEYYWAAMHASSHVFGALLMAAVGYSLMMYLKT